MPWTASFHLKFFGCRTNAPEKWLKEHSSNVSGLFTTEEREMKKKKPIQSNNHRILNTHTHTHQRQELTYILKTTKWILIRPAHFDFIIFKPFHRSYKEASYSFFHLRLFFFFSSFILSFELSRLNFHNKSLSFKFSPSNSVVWILSFKLSRLNSLVQILSFEFSLRSFPKTRLHNSSWNGYYFAVFHFLPNRMKQNS